MPERAPLQDFRVVGFTRKISSPVPGVSQPGGSCWHCGAALINCVQVRHNDTGETVDVGIDCAKRAGLDPAGLKQMLAEQRQEQYRAEFEADRETERALAAAEDARFGSHGSESRYSEGGCRCAVCRAEAPHGTLDRVEFGRCVCESCVDAALSSGDFKLEDRLTLIDAGSGRRIDHARIVQTRYGSRWAVDVDPDDQSSGTDWYPVAPKRRSTMLNKGVLEARAPFLVRAGRHSSPVPIGCVEDPAVDSWGEPIVTSDTA